MKDTDTAAGLRTANNNNYTYLPPPEGTDTGTYVSGYIIINGGPPQYFGHWAPVVKDPFDPFLAQLEGPDPWSEPEDPVEEDIEKLLGL